MNIVLSVLFLFLVVGLVASYSERQTEEAIRTHILQNYTSESRPRDTYNTSLPITVSLYFSLLFIKEFDEKVGKLSIGFGGAFLWTDSDLTWTTTDFDGIQSVMMKKDNIWYPPLFLGNGFDGPYRVGDDFKNELVTITAYGYVTWKTIIMTAVQCTLNTTYFPFDKQTCSLVFSSFYYYRTDIEFSANSVNLDYFSEHIVWKPSSTNIYTHDYGDGHNYELILEITLDRKPLYYVINIILPVVLIGVLNVFVFMVPADSGERVGFSITLLLAMSVFLTIVSENLPESISIVSWLLLGDLVLSVLTAISVIIGLRFHFASEKDLIQNKYLTFHKFIRSCSCKNKVNATPMIHPTKDEDKGVIFVKSDNGKIDDNCEKELNMTCSDDVIVTWKDVTVSLDTVCFGVYGSLQILKLLVYIILFVVSS